MSFINKPAHLTDYKLGISIVLIFNVDVNVTKFLMKQIQVRIGQIIKVFIKSSP